MSTMNLTLLTDFYELTMMQGYFKSQAAETVIFDAFYRQNPNGGGYAIAAGLEQVIDYIKNLHFSRSPPLFLPVSDSLLNIACVSPSPGSVCAFLCYLPAVL